jgi:ADP-ribose pyrophosphatase YjhB (NUDIX family)
LELYRPFRLENEILKIARRVQSVAQAGLHYAENDFDRQRYEELRDLSVQLAAAVSDTEIEKIRNLFTGETGFQTPKVDIRSVVLKDNKVLLARERCDGKYSLPGGFADINYSPGEVAVKEVLEETGLDVRVKRVLAIIDTDRHNFPPLEYHYYKIVILCDLIGGELSDSNETTEAGFFDFDNLPELSEKRNTPELFALIKRQLESQVTYTD